MNPKTLLRIPWRVRCVAAVAVGLAGAHAADAFYFKGWPGDQLPRPPVLISPSAPVFAHPPSAHIDTQPPPPPIDTTPPDTPPNGGGKFPPPTPEPASFLLVAAGLGALAASRLRRVRKFGC
jgi:hypothetical protein